MAQLFRIVVTVIGCFTVGRSLTEALGPERVEAIAVAVALPGVLIVLAATVFTAWVGRPPAVHAHSKAESVLPSSFGTVPTVLTRSTHAWDGARSSIAPTLQDDLLGLNWIDRAENLVLHGPPGTGKSQFCSLLVAAASASGRTACWLTPEGLGKLIEKGSPTDKMIEGIIECDLVVLDGLGPVTLRPEVAECLYRLVDKAYGTTSLAVSSIRPPMEFGRLLTEEIAAPLVDRLLHHAHVVNTKGESFRITDAQELRPVRGRFTANAGTSGGSG